MIDTATREQIRDATDVVSLIRESVDLRSSGSEYRGLCPFHDDHTPSLCVNPIKRRWYCHPCNKSGDAFAWVMERDNVQFVEAARLLADAAGLSEPLAPSAKRIGATVAQLVRAKSLDVAVVKALGITDTIHKGTPAIAFPYFLTGQDKAPIAVHFRRTLDKVPGVPRFEWRPGDRQIPYGLWLLSSSTAYERGVWIVEGETDFIALTQHGYAAIGIPGARWRDEWSHYAEGISRFYVAIEPDSGGMSLAATLGQSSIAKRCIFVKMGSLAGNEARTA